PALAVRSRFRHVWNAAELVGGRLGRGVFRPGTRRGGRPGYGASLVGRGVAGGAGCRRRDPAVGGQLAVLVGGGHGGTTACLFGLRASLRVGQPLAAVVRRRRNRRSAVGEDQQRRRLPVPARRVCTRHT